MASASEAVVVDLNVGGVHYTTTLDTLTSDRCMHDSPLNRLAQVITENDVSWPRDKRGRWFIDRDGILFRYVLDYIRTGSLTLPDMFAECRRLSVETAYFRLADGATEQLQRVQLNAADPIVNGSSLHNNCTAVAAPPSSESKKSGLSARATTQRGSVVASSVAAVGATASSSGFITIGYRGTFSCGGRADGLSDIRFRKIWRILVSGRVALCRQVFGDTLNDSRNPDNALYSARFYLKHSSIERAFDALQVAGFQMVAACATGTNNGLSGMNIRGGPTTALRTFGDLKSSGPGMSASASASATFLVPISMTVESEEARWSHYNEFVFCRPS